MEKRNNILKIGSGIVIGFLIILLIFTGVRNLSSSQNNLGNDVENSEDNNQEVENDVDADNDDIVEDNDVIEDDNSSDIENEEEDMPYLEELPEIKDDFEKALFLYGLFMSPGELVSYSDTNEIIESEERMWALVKIKGVKSLNDLKKIAYEVFDKEFLDKEVMLIQSSEYPMFKETKDGLYTLHDAAQLGSDFGYTGKYEKITNSDETIIYKVPIKDSIYGDSTQCNVVYEYKMKKNSDGKFVFTNFELPVDICLRDIEKKENN